MANSTLALTGAIAEYYQNFGFKEHALLAELRQETATIGTSASMQIAPEQGAFLGLMAAISGAQHILEIGTFTGYSSLAMALAGPAQIVAVDVSEEWTAIARRFWKKAGVDGRVKLDLTGGTAAIGGLLKAGKAGRFDMCFIDADKTGYDHYYEGALKLLRSGGIVLIDNVLWGGEVADPSKTDADTGALRRLNTKIAQDNRVDYCIVPIGDGLTLARKR